MRKLGQNNYGTTLPPVVAVQRQRGRRRDRGRPEAESFVNANGSDWSKSSAAVVLETCSIDGALLAKAGYARTTLNEGRRNDRRKRVA